MEKDYFLNAGVPQTTMPFPWSGLNFTSDQSFLDHPAAGDAFILRELIGKLGGGGTPFSGANTSSTNDCNYRTPITILDHHHMNMANLGSSSLPLTPPPPPLPSLSGDPGFAERAAKFSCFGSRSFNGRSSQFELNINGELGHRSNNNPLMENGKLPRVFSSPSLKHGCGSPAPENKNLYQAQMEMRSLVNGVKLSGSGTNSSNENSSVSEQIPSGETGSKTSNEMNSRKRKMVSRGKPKEDRSNPAKGIEGDEDGEGGAAKRQKPAENGTKIEEETKGNGSKDEQKTNQKPPEPPKDYIHVRARRGQATDSHSLAERVRREKISERMKLLQDLVPGCNKVTGKALMLDEIINYVQSLQRQVEFLSMKLASVNPGMDFNMENLLPKDMYQQNTTLPQQIYPLDSSTPTFYHNQQHHPQQQIVQQAHNSNVSTGPMSQCPVDNSPLDAHNLGLQLPSLDGFSESLPQFPAFSEDDLHSIIQMSFSQNSINFPVSNQTSNMKVER